MCGPKASRYIDHVALEEVHGDDLRRRASELGFDDLYRASLELRAFTQEVFGSDGHESPRNRCVIAPVFRERLRRLAYLFDLLDDVFAFDIAHPVPDRD